MGIGEGGRRQTLGKEKVEAGHYLPSYVTERGRVS